MGVGSVVTRVREDAIYLFSVAIEVLIESLDGVSNKVDEKFGNPQVQQIQVTFGVRPRKTARSMPMYLTWNQDLQFPSHNTLFWLLFTGF